MQNMLINSIMNGVGSLGIASATPGLANGKNSSPFGSMLQSAISKVQDLEAAASETTQSLIRGDGVDIHTAMIATQKADLAFEMALSVRNKAVAAYQQVMGMQF